jgi:hypothetical protein
MTTGTTTGTVSAGHRHDRHCYWDYMECGWVCGPRPASVPQPAPEAAQDAVAEPAGAPQPSFVAVR